MKFSQYSEHVGFKLIKTGLNRSKLVTHQSYKGKAADRVTAAWCTTLSEGQQLCITSLTGAGTQWSKFAERENHSVFGPAGDFFFFLCNVMNLCCSQPFVRDFLWQSHLGMVLVPKNKTSWTTHSLVHYWRLQGQIHFVLSSMRYESDFL